MNSSELAIVVTARKSDEKYTHKKDEDRPKITNAKQTNKPKKYCVGMDELKTQKEKKIV